MGRWAVTWMADRRSFGFTLLPQGHGALHSRPCGNVETRVDCELVMATGSSRRLPSSFPTNCIGTHCCTIRLPCS